MSATFRLKQALPAILLLTAAPAFAQPEIYTLDPLHTAVNFQIDHFGFSAPTGKFMNVEGTLVLDEDAPENSTLEVTIPVTKVTTGVPALDEHLQKEEFFNTSAFPEATFASTSVELTGENTAKVTGTLTLRGVSQPVTLDVTLNKIGENFTGKKTAGFAASATVKRTDFGVSAYAPALGDEVTLTIQSEANLAITE